MHKGSIALLAIVASSQIFLSNAGSIGCFNDNPDDPDLPFGIRAGADMAISACFKFCRYKNYRYAGMQGEYCNCGQTYGKYGATTGCTTKCPANQNQICGGPNKNTVYDVSPNATPANPTLELTNDGKTYNLLCRVTLALPGAIYRMVLLADGAEFDNTTLINEGDATTGELTYTVPVETVKDLFGKTVRCSVRGRWIADNEPNGWKTERATKEDQTIGVKVVRAADNSAITAANPLKLNEGTPATRMAVSLYNPPVEKVTLSFKATGMEPVVCQYTGASMEQIVMDKCQLTFTKDDFSTPQEIQVQAVEDYKNDGPQTAAIEMSIVDSGESAIDGSNPFDFGEENGSFGGSTIDVISDEFPNIDSGSSGSTCSSKNDPHMTSFDGVKFDTQMEGEFILYKHTEYPFEVRTFYKRCTFPYTKATCNCAVAARVGDDVIVVDKCGGSRGLAQPLTVKRFSASDDVFAPGFNVMKVGTAAYDIVLPTGARLKVRMGTTLRNFLNFWMNPSNADAGKTLGLCGVYDGNKVNDLTAKSGVVSPHSKRPDAFSRSWRVTGDSLYNGQVPAGSITFGLPGEPMCGCKDGEKEAQCEAKPQNRCQKPGPDAEIPITTPDPTAPEFGPYDPEFNPEEPTFPTPDGKTEDDAIAKCKEALDNAPAFANCDIDKEAIMNDCVADVKLSDTFDFVPEAIGAAQVECEELIIHDPDKPLPPDSFCPHDCSGNGQCVENKCQCNAGFACEDCSCVEDKAPDFNVFPSCCDEKSEDCSAAVSIIGHFDDSITYNCQVEDAESGEAITTKSEASYENFDHLSCALGVVLRPGKYNVKLFVNDDSKTMRYGVYNSDCMECDINSEIQRTPNTCTIGGKCYNDGDKNPEDPLDTCDSENDENNWTGPDPCDLVECSHDCSSETGDAVCSCPDGMVLGEDKLNCEDITYPDVKPEINIDENDDGTYKFECQYTKENKTNYIVTWFIDGEEINATLHTDEISPARLREVLNVESLIGKSISCSVKGQYDNNPDPEDLGPEEKSPEKPIGIEIAIDGNPLNPANPEVPLIEGEVTPVDIRPTVPVKYLKVCFSVEEPEDKEPMVCEHTGQVMEQVVLGVCCLEFNKDNWDIPQQIPMQAVEDFKIEGNTKYTIKYTWTTEDPNPARTPQVDPEPAQADPAQTPQVDTEANQQNNVDRRQLEDAFGDDAFGFGGDGDFDASIDDDFPDADPDTTTTSTSTCDPHMSSFDGKNYNMMLEGEFIFYKHATLPIEVRTFYRRCSHPYTAATCNCAVAVRAGDDVVVVDKCGGNSPLTSPTRVRTYTGNDDKFTTQMKLSKRQAGREYVVSLPNGARVEVFIATPPSVQNFLNVRMNPGMGDRGQISGLVGNYNGNAGDDMAGPDGNMIGAGNAFGRAWRVNPAQTMYGGVVPADAVTMVKRVEDKLCACKGTLEGGEACNAEAVNRCERPVDPEPIDPVAPTPGEPEFPYDPEFDPEEPTFPTPDGKTEEEATEKCNELFENSPATNPENCPHPDKQHYIDLCVEDVKLSDTFDFGPAMLEQFKKDCEDIIENLPNPTVPDVFCPHDCHHQGSCVENVCQCDEGWTCADCSCATDKPSPVALLPQCCDMDDVNNDCSAVEFGGEGFGAEESYTCMLKNKANGEVVSAVLALHYNFELLHCHFEKATIKPSVDYEVVLRFVSPAGETLDQAVDYGVFSSQCQECAEGVNTLKDGTCLIDDVCYNDGDFNPADLDAQKCDSERDPEDWTPVCPEGPHCIVDGECVPDGTVKIDNDMLECDVETDPEGWTPRDPCDTAGCSHTCDEGVCSCPEDMTLADDQKNCEPKGPECAEGAECLIDGECIPDGQVNADNEFEKCDVETDPEGWTPRDPCEIVACSHTCDMGMCSCPDNMKLGDDHLTCEPKCTEGAECLIDGECIPDGTVNIENDMLVCDVETDPEGWTPRDPCDTAGCSHTCNEGVCSCPDDMTLAEDQKTCEPKGPECAEGTECLIDGECIPDGQVNTDNDMLECDVEKDPEGWTPRDPCDTAGCSHTCNEGVCSCPEGMKLGEDQKTCELECPPVTLKYCEFGNMEDENGCKLSRCKCNRGTECTIDGKCYQDGTVNTDNDMLECDVETDPLSWTPRDPCDTAGCSHSCDEGVCSCPEDMTLAEDQKNCEPKGPECAEGTECLIDGECIPEGTVNMENAMFTCVPGTDPEGWTPRDACAIVGCSHTCVEGVCTCPEDMTLAEDQKNCEPKGPECAEGTECLIDGECIPEGTVNMENAMFTCVPGTDPEGWTPRDACAIVGCSHTCVEGVCTCPEDMTLAEDQKNCEPKGPECAEGTECLIDGECIPEGTVNMENAMFTCVPGTDPEGWTPRDACAIVGCSHTCVEGVCTCPEDMTLAEDQKNCEPKGPECAEGTECLIDGECIPEGTVNMENAMFTCVPGTDPEGWTPRDACAIVGCSHTCVEGVCTCPEDMTLAEDQKNCEPKGPECAEGTECLIDGECIPEGTVNMENAMFTCVPGTDPEGWTPRDACAIAGCSHTCVEGVCSCPEGMKLGEDQKTCELECPPVALIYCEFGNMEDENGCKLSRCKCNRGTECTIDGKCYQDGTVNTDNDMLECDVETDPLSWTPRSPCDIAACSHTCDVGVCSCPEDMTLAEDQKNCEPKGPECAEGTECLIDGECIPDGQVNADNDMLECDVETDPEGWTPRDPCDTAGCSHTCDEGVCSCPEDMTLSEDKKTCEGTNPAVNSCEEKGCDQLCDVIDDQAVCLCRIGFKKISEAECADLNECEINNGGCQEGCDNTIGGWECTCPESMELTVDGKTCEPKELNPCDECSHDCMADGDDFVCLCPKGYKLAVDDRTCIDIDECEKNNGGCVLECFNEPGHHTCECQVQCQPGYVAVEEMCVPACQVNNGGCSHICDMDVDKNVVCSCPNEGRINPIDEKTCLGPCKEDGTGGGCEEICTSTDNFHVQCECKNGKPVNADGKTCTDNNLVGCEQGEMVADGLCIPKCDVNNGNCHEDKECSTEGDDVICTCPDGEMEIADGSCAEECPAGFEMDMETGECNDIDECADNNGECEDVCNNKEGTYVCTCTEGALDIDGKSCTTVDPCLTDNGGCEHDCVFVETEGQLYKCECNDGFLLNEDKHTCDSLCDVDNGGCDAETEECVMNEVNQATCVCAAGFVMQDGECVDICETEENTCDQVCERTDNKDEPFVCSCAQGFNMEDGECVDGCEKHGCEKECTNLLNGDFECSCDEGEMLNEDGKNCDDVNECDEFNGQCSHECVNDVPGHHCECPEDMELDVDQKTCIDYNACEKDDPCDHNCEVTEGKGFECTCDNGYQLAADLTTCLDKCHIDNGGCSDTCEHAEDGTVMCTCKEGYQLAADGKTCEDIDECAEDNADCDMGCDNTEGSYVCTCPEGFQLSTDGKQCDDVDPCSINNGDCSHDCTHVDDQAVCTCPDTMELGDDKQTCKHKCDIGNNGCEHVCDRDTTECTCNQGWELADDNKSCEDKNECTEELDDCDQVCNNVEGSYECSCEEGYMPANADSSQCEDIDECAANNGGCRQTCNNLQGSYRCECDDDLLCVDGYVRDEVTDKCLDINECATNNGGCTGNCVNTEGDFYCN